MRVLATCVAILCALPAHSATIRVPADQPTIQTGIDAASPGDTVEVACGTYFEHDLVMVSGVTLRSASGDPSCTTVDGGLLGRVLFCSDVEEVHIEGLTFTRGKRDFGDGAALLCSGSQIVVRNCVFSESSVGKGFSGGGVTVKQGSAVSFTSCTITANSAGDVGGGMDCTESALRLETCTFEGNYAADGGGGLYVESLGADPEVSLIDCVFLENEGAMSSGAIAALSSSLVITGCAFERNVGGGGAGAIGLGEGTMELSECVLSQNSADLGGAILLGGAKLTLTGCTLVANTASDGAAISSYDPAPPSQIDLERTIVAGHEGGAPIACGEDDAVSLTCCDVYANQGGDWIGCISDQGKTNGNFSADPLFCDADDGNYHLAWGSPCLPANSAGCGLIGAHSFAGSSCPDWPAPLEPVSWGRIKSMYRERR